MARGYSEIVIVLVVVLVLDRVFGCARGRALVVARIRPDTDGTYWYPMFRVGQIFRHSDILSLLTVSFRGEDDDENDYDSPTQRASPLQQLKNKSLQIFGLR
jgi:hypothetical protein